MIATNEIDEYFLLMEQRPELFNQSEELPIVTDRKIIEDYMQKENRKIGIVYKSKYNMMLVDLIKSSDGTLYSYERIVPASLGRAVVCIPVYKGKVVMLHQFRHAPREYQLCFPRGFGENGISSEDNARKELFEEIGADVRCAEYLGRVIADSGLSSGGADILLCEIDSYIKGITEEGISSTSELTLCQLENKIARGEITDGFTLSALALLKSKKINL